MEAQRRKAANELVFREVNERISAVQERFALTAAEPLRIVCECDRIACAETLTVGLETYERTRSDGACFFVLPGHQDEKVEDVIETGRGYLIVRKRAGEPAEIARAGDPRA